MSTEPNSPGDAFADPARLWKQWHEARTEAVSGPYGPLALTGTHWIDDAAEGRIPAVPGRWAVSADGGEVILTAGPEDGLALDGAPFTGEARLAADSGPTAASRLAQGERRLVLLRRDGLWAVRVWDPASPARQAFRGIETTPYDPRWSVPGRFTPYDPAAARSVRVPNVDGVERELGLGGELAFTLAGTDHTLQVTVEADGSLWAVFADATSGADSYRFRFLRPAAPDADGRTTVDFNRTLLPPCALADHFLCPFPPPGNTLPLAIAAGERNPVTG
ncbi:DUF1684 domain-containing protein [Streptomyces sp. NPDC060194]|uniref:DUF1684 domain-containing protein n=1 Tax=Streptomyces sp. NPDC060194 TaxID=3347069 RepID=UPI00364DD2B7